MALAEAYARREDAMGFLTQLHSQQPKSAGLSPISQSIIFSASAPSSGFQHSHSSPLHSSHTLMPALLKSIKMTSICGLSLSLPLNRWESLPRHGDKVML